MSSNQVLFIGENNSYYAYNGKLYTGTFPQEWAKTHLPGTGPSDCKMCQRVGYWNGVFVGYCVKCASKYSIADKYSKFLSVVDKDLSVCRGGGFFDSICNGENASIHDKNAAMNTYLANIPLDEIGHKDILDSAAMMNKPEGISKTLREIMAIQKNK